MLKSQNSTWNHHTDDTSSLWSMLKSQNSTWNHHTDDTSSLWSMLNNGGYRVNADSKKGMSQNSTRNHHTDDTSSLWPMLNVMAGVVWMQVLRSDERALRADTLAAHAEPGHVQRGRRPPQTLRVPACPRRARQGTVHGVPAWRRHQLRSVEEDRTVVLNCQALPGVGLRESIFRLYETR